MSVFLADVVLLAVLGDQTPHVQVVLVCQFSVVSCLASEQLLKLSSIFFEPFSLLLHNAVFLLLLFSLSLMSKELLIESLDARNSFLCNGLFLELFDFDKVVLMAIIGLAFFAEGEMLTFRTLVSHTDDGVGRAQHASVVLVNQLLLHSDGLLLRRQGLFSDEGHQSPDALIDQGGNCLCHQSVEGSEVVVGCLLLRLALLLDFLFFDFLLCSLLLDLFLKEGLFLSLLFPLGSLFSFLLLSFYSRMLFSLFLFGSLFSFFFLSFGCFLPLLFFLFSSLLFDFFLLFSLLFFL
jgi:hypothetical protein